MGSKYRDTSEFNDLVQSKRKKNKIKKPLLNKFYINYVLKLHYFYILVK